MRQEIDPSINNQHWESLKRFKAFDPQLKRLQALPFKYVSPLEDEESFHHPGIFLLTGGRQVGKTTFLKQYIATLIEKKKIKPLNIRFVTGELIKKQDDLQNLIASFYQEGVFQYCLIDEVSYIPDWDQALKYCADVGLLETMCVIVTGSDGSIIRTAIKRLAGRRGKQDQVDFEFHPLSFKEMVKLKAPKLGKVIEAIQQTPIVEPSLDYEKNASKFQTLFEDYCIHGGYLPAIRDWEVDKTIHKATMTTYRDWVVGDMLGHQKSEQSLFEIIKGLHETQGTQVSWNSLAKYMAIDHHKTVSDYCYLLEDLHALHIIDALDENKLSAAPKKHKKVFIRDPFIAHALYAFLTEDFSIENIQQRLKIKESIFVEHIVLDHFKRYYKTFYIKGKKGEVDAAILQGKKFTPVEVKWTNQLRPEELKQLLSYDNGLVLTKQKTERKFEKFSAVPLLRFLLSLPEVL